MSGTGAVAEEEGQAQGMQSSVARIPYGSESSATSFGSTATAPPSVVAASAEPPARLDSSVMGVAVVRPGSVAQAGSIGPRYGPKEVGATSSHPGYVRSFSGSWPWCKRKCITGPNARKPVVGRISPVEEAIRNFQSRNEESIILPVVGMVFDSFDEAYEYYNLYSWEQGFGIRCSSSVSNKGDYVVMRELTCMCQGAPKGATMQSVMCGCNEKIVLRRTEDHAWYIRIFEAAHNHLLSETCGEKRQWPSHKFLDEHSCEIVRHLRQSNVKLGKVYSIMTSIFGSVDRTPITKRKLKTLCSELSRQNATDDMQKTVQLFMRLRDEDPEFVYKVDFDEDGTIKTLMWTNGKGKIQYAHFGDVVTFDTTYKTNLYGMPFGMFVGVSNHFHSVLFAGVLMRSETTVSFRWVFKEFVSMMGGRQPITVLTDQAAAMQSAIEFEWIGTRHRWCKWHVLRLAKEHLGLLYTKENGFKACFHKLINSMMSVEEFENGWELLMAEYNISTHPFIERIFHERYMWAKAYFRDVFCAGQTSTQRSESANHMLKNQVPPWSPMHMFVLQYLKLVGQRDEEEDFEKRRCKLARRRPVFNNNIERHAMKIYNPKMMEVVGKEIYEAGYYRVEMLEPKKRYEVVHVNEEKRERWCRVRFDVTIHHDGQKYSCDCGQEEHTGLLCCHIIKEALKMI